MSAPRAAGRGGGQRDARLSGILNYGNPPHSKPASVYIKRAWRVPVRSGDVPPGTPGLSRFCGLNGVERTWTLMLQLGHGLLWRPAPQTSFIKYRPNAGSQSDPPVQTLVLTCAPVLALMGPAGMEMDAPVLYCPPMVNAGRHWWLLCTGPPPRHNLSARGRTTWRGEGEPYVHTSSYPPEQKHSVHSTPPHWNGMDFAIGFSFQ
ncbi:unnamed protein product [Arctogadus glacialis]